MGETGISLTRKHLPIQSQQKKQLEKVWNMFKVNNEDTRMTSFILLTPFFLYF